MIIKPHDEVPPRVKEILDLAHSIAEQSYAQIWDMFCQAANQINEEWPTDDILTATATLAGHFIGRWVQAMHMVASADDGGQTGDELLHDVFEGAAATISVKAPVRRAKSNFEFKRL
jgi:hypothetical protein